MRSSDIDRAVAVLLSGGSVVFPTETLYGLAAMATNKKAVGKIYTIKGRNKEKFLPVIVGGMAQAEKYFIFDRTERTLAEKFWPGPLSLILRTRSKKIATAMGGGRIAVRWSANRIAAALANGCDVPITATSANLSGKPGCFTVAAVKRQFAGAHLASPVFFMNGGALKKSLPSTIVRIERGHIVVLREGKIDVEKHFPALIGHQKERYT